jgi:hypothetical protein
MKKRHSRTIISALVVALALTGCGPDKEADDKAGADVSQEIVTGIGSSEKISKEEQEFRDKEKEICEKYTYTKDKFTSREVYDKAAAEGAILTEISNSHSLEISSPLSPFESGSTDWANSIYDNFDSNKDYYKAEYFVSYKLDKYWTTKYELWVRLKNFNTKKDFVFDVNNYPAIKDVILKVYDKDFIDFASNRINYFIKQAAASAEEEPIYTSPYGQFFPPYEISVINTKDDDLSIHITLTTGYGDTAEASTSDPSADTQSVFIKGSDVAYDGEWEYSSVPSVINKKKKDGSEQQDVAYIDKSLFASLNFSNIDVIKARNIIVYNGWIYYVTGFSDYSMLCKVRTDGTFNQQIKAHGNWPSIEDLYLVGDLLYYVDRRSGTFKVSIDGSGVTEVTDEKELELLKQK